SATTSTGPASVAFVTTSPAAPVAPVSTAASATIAVPAEGMIAELEVLGGPDWLAADDHGVWVKLDNGTVVLIDPATNSVVETFDVGGDPCQGLGAGDGAIWACSG